MRRGVRRADNGLGALPFDTYELEELRCPANAIFEMIRDEIVVDESDEGLVIDLGTLNNTGTGKPTIRTSAYDGLSDDLYDTQISADAKAVVIDRVTYSGLEPGEPYLLRGTLMDKATGEPFLVNEEEVAAELEFAPEDYNGYANVTFAFDASAITEDTNLVVFETLLQDGVEVASHRDLADRKQTIAVSPIAIGTTAVDAATGTHEGVPAEEVTIIDTVSYQGLTPGEEYELSAVLMDKEENAPWLVEDKVVMVSHRFIPEESSGHGGCRDHHSRHQLGWREPRGLRIAAARRHRGGPPRRHRGRGADRLLRLSRPAAAADRRRRAGEAH